MRRKPAISTRGEKPHLRRICVACNEDGFGPSAFGFYLTRALVEYWRLGNAAGKYPFELQVTVLNHTACEFNRSIYASFPEVRVRCEPDSLIKFARCGEEIDIPQTLNLLERYEACRDTYLSAITPVLGEADVAIDIGVPLFARSARQLGVKRRITLFDHSWAATLQLACLRKWSRFYTRATPPSDSDRAMAHRLAQVIAEDERQTGEVFLFPRVLTPPPFVAHWRKLGCRPNILKGVLGARANPAQAWQLLAGLMAELGQSPLPKDKRLVLISGGGTQVWAELWPLLIENYLARPKPPDHMAVLSNPKFSSPDIAAALKERIRREGAGRISWYEHIRGTPQQPLLPAFNLVISRAGGGIVNDCLATRVPLICLPEKQVQIALIHAECVRAGLIPPATLSTMTAFRDAPCDFIARRLPRSRHPRLHLPAGAEVPLAKNILNRL
jgi:hypothetical protein